MAEFEPRRAFEHLDKLAYEIGPRLAGTRGDGMAADYVRKQFESYGLKTRVQEFEFVDRATRAKVTACILAAAFITLLFLPPEPSLLVWALALVVWRSLGWLMPKRKSQNVIGALGARESKKGAAITAHYDSAPCMVSYGLHLFVKFTFAPALVFITLALALRAFGLLSAWSILWGMLAFVFMPVCVGIFVAASGRRVSPGADDNASGVMVMLEAARVAAESPPADARLTFVALGAEEQGLVGARKLVASKTLPKDTMVLNLDMVGAGSQAYVIEGSGVFRRRRTSPELNERLANCMKSVGLNPKFWWAALAGYDHIPFVRAKMRATTFSINTLEKDKFGNFIARTFGLPNAKTIGYPHIHTLEDTPERVELANIERAGAVVLEFIKTILPARQIATEVVR